MDHLAEDLPRYRVNILAKIADVRGAGRAAVVEVRRVLPECTQRRGAIGLAGRARGVRPVDARVRRRMLAVAYP
jgi:hypothetical protein